LGNRSIDGWFFHSASGLVTLTLGLLLVVTMPISPFTEQYARNACPPARRAAPQAPSAKRCSEPHAAPVLRRRGVSLS